MGKFMKKTNFKKFGSIFLAFTLLVNVFTVNHSYASTVSQATMIVEYALSQVGTKERSSRSDDIIYNDWYYGRRVKNRNTKVAEYPWCHAFVSYCANVCGISTNVIPKTASCQQGVKFFTSQGRYHKRNSNYVPKVGDIIYLSTDGTSTAHHVGIVYAIENNKVYYVDGNNTTTDPHSVCKSSKSLTSKSILGYGSPNYKSSTDNDNTPVGKPSIDNVKILDISSKTMKFSFDVNNATKLVRIVVINKKTGQESKQDFYPKQARNYTLDWNFNEQEGNEYYVRIYAYSQKTGSNETLHAITYGNTIGLVQLPKAETKPSIEVGSYLENTPSSEVFLEDIVRGWAIVKGSNIAKFTVWINGEEVEIEKATRKDVENVYPNHNCAGWQWTVNMADLVDGDNAYSIRVHLSNGEIREIAKGTIKAKKVNLFDVNYFWDKYSKTDSKVRSIGKNKRALERYFYAEGIQKGMSPSVIIVLSEYKQLNSDVARVVGNDNKSLMNHLLRYTLNGKGEYRRLTSKFSLEAYRNKNGDLSKMSPKELVEHYIYWGQYENRVTK